MLYTKKKKVNIKNYASYEGIPKNESLSMESYLTTYLNSFCL